MPGPSCSLSRSVILVSHFCEAEPGPARHDEPHRPAVDVRQRLAVHPPHDQRVRLHRLLERARRARAAACWRRRRDAGRTNSARCISRTASARRPSARRRAARRSIRRSPRRRWSTGCRARAARRRSGRCRRIRAPCGRSPRLYFFFSSPSVISSLLLTSPSMTIFQASGSFVSSGICPLLRM